MLYKLESANLKDVEKERKMPPTSARYNQAPMLERIIMYFYVAIAVS